MEVTNNETTIAVMANDMSYMKRQLESIDGKLSSGYVTKQELERLRDQVKLLNRFMYGVITLALLAIAYALLNLIGLGRQ